MEKQHDIYTSVLQVYPDLIDGENKLNKERAQAILDTQTMSDENRNLLQNLIDLQEQAEEAQQALRDYLEGTFGSLGDSIMDSITEAIENDGVDAWEKFGEKDLLYWKIWVNRLPTLYSSLISSKDYKQIWRKSTDPAKQKKK